MRTLTAKPRSDACQRGSANAQSNGKPLPAARTGGGDATHSRPHALGDTLQPTTTRRPMTNRAPPLRQESTTKPHPAARTRPNDAAQTVPPPRCRTEKHTYEGSAHTTIKAPGFPTKKRDALMTSTSRFPFPDSRTPGPGHPNSEAPGFSHSRPAKSADREPRAASDLRGRRVRPVREGPPPQSGPIRSSGRGGPPPRPSAATPSSTAGAACIPSSTDGARAPRRPSAPRCPSPYRPRRHRRRSSP